MAAVNITSRQIGISLNNMQGVSVIICCHNGAARLPATLQHLKAQEGADHPWEVLLVDNASTDGSDQLALSLWDNAPVPLRVVSELRLGLSYARKRGLAESKYEFLGFVDDDNWLAPDWVRTAHKILSSDASLGALGSIQTPVCDISAPGWFNNFHSSYAVLTDHDLERIQEPPEYLAGAGLCVRKAAWDKLIQNGYKPQLTGRKGKKLQSGEDAELTMALRLSGWNLRIDPRLRLQHFMPAQRLHWSYLRKLLRNYSASHVLLDAYSKHSLSLQPGFRRWLSDRWWYQFGEAMKKMTSHPSAVIAALLSDGEGRREITDIERNFGRALGLLRCRRQYTALRQEVRDAAWRDRLNYYKNLASGRA